MKGVRVTKVVNEIKFEEVWCELEEKTSFQRQFSIHKIFESNSSFHVK